MTDFKKELNDFMVKDLKNGVPSFEVEEFAGNFGYSYQEFFQKTRNIDVPKLWDSAIEIAQSELKVELKETNERLKEIEKQINSFPLKLPFLFKNEKNALIEETKHLNKKTKIDIECGLINSIHYHADLKNRFVELKEYQQDQFMESNLDNNLLSKGIEKERHIERQKSNDDYELEL
jgi:hypothetical protein